ncbi:MAG: NAD-dependent epimerase/dehydratase family protein [Planctomycetota bacterium]|jgi:UDP-glucose 4-epimerase
MRVLVCGGAGYIGSNMTAMLTSEGYEPVVFDNLSKGHISAIGEAEFVRGDLADYEHLAATLDDYSIEAVMHFAAFIEVGESVAEPLRYYRNNFSYTQNLLSAMEAYGQTKLAVEKMCHDQHEAGKLAYAALRYFNACGAGNNATLGEDHRPESHLIPLTIQAAMGKRADIRIYGTDYDTPDGTGIRDYIHIDDLCRAHLLALDKLDENREIVCNLGNETGHSVREVIETVRKVSGRDFKVVEADRRQGDPPVLTADAARARNELSWKIEKPDLEKMVSTAWQWHTSHPDGYPD